MTAPRMRAADADRQATADRLTRHFTEGRLDANEYDERVGKAYAAVYLDDFAGLFGDLPEEPVQRPDPAWAARDAFRGTGYGRPPWAGPQRPTFGGPGLRRPPRILAVLAVLAIFFAIGAIINGLFFFPGPLIWIAVIWLFMARGGRFHHGAGRGGQSGR